MIQIKSVSFEHSGTKVSDNSQVQSMNPIFYTENPACAVMYVTGRLKVLLDTKIFSMEWT